MSELTPEHWIAFEEANKAYEQLALRRPNIPLVQRVTDHGDFSPGLVKEFLEEIIAEYRNIPRESMFMTIHQSLVQYKVLAEQIYFLTVNTH